MKRSELVSDFLHFGLALHVGLFLLLRRGFFLFNFHFDLFDGCVLLEAKAYLQEPLQRGNEFNWVLNEEARVEESHVVE